MISNITVLFTSYIVILYCLTLTIDQIIYHIVLYSTDLQTHTLYTSNIKNTPHIKTMPIALGHVATNRCRL